MAFPKYQSKEVLNKVLNSGEDALKVDIDNVTLKTEGSDITVEVHTDKAEDSMLIFANTNKAGSGTSYVPLVDSDGHLQVDAVSSALPSGAATAANQSTIIGHVDGVETLLGTIDSDTDAIKTAVELLDNAVDGNYLNVNANIAGTDFVGGAGAVASGVQRVTLASDDPAVTDLAAIEVLLTAANVDHAANEVLLTGIDADTNAIKVDMAAIEVLLTAANVDHAANEALLTTIDSDTNDIKTATEAAQASLADMVYGTAVAIDIDSGNHGSLSHNALYVGTGGNVKVNMGTSGSGITFSNVASGQILPIQITQVYQSGTTASNMVALKE
tara:strand:- start:25 stop:1011 length:987 start_codon:yes stop_codon:yes gene_type:complete